MSASRSSLAAVFLLLGVLVQCNAQLSTSFYASSCPNISSVVRNVVEQALRGNVRAGAALIRLHFHDCFVDGCDGSLLLDNADGIESEKDAPPNQGAGGFPLVDDIKTALENVCPGVVSCADILALSSQISAELTGGPRYEVPLGRRDSTTANRQGATRNLPGPFATLAELRANFSVQGLDSTDLVALSGAHTFGRARCFTFRTRLYDFEGPGAPDSSIDATYLETLRQTCPQDGDNNAVENLDQSTPDDFDNDYFENLQTNKGLLRSDQVLFSTSGADTINIVNRFAGDQNEFFDAYVQSIIKMGNISPLTGTQGEIRSDCKRVN